MTKEEKKLKQEIANISNEILAIFNRENLTLAIIQDVMETLHNHLKIGQLRLRMKDLFSRPTIKK